MLETRRVQAGGSQPDTEVIFVCLFCFPQLSPLGSILRNFGFVVWWRAIIVCMSPCFLSSKMRIITPTFQGFAVNQMR